ncbi:MAG: sigma-54 dependent transcriptional regulator [Candidatus Rokubacteria bacterium]|nr:sigma-54 dependent transcriptional regulator [Candidatus Rokubacteria bacterium]
MTERRVLVVDDDAEMSAMLARHLESEDMAVVAATGGREALKALTSQEFDVVITDLVMDDVGGLEVLAAATRCRPAPRIILMTAFGTLETAIEAMRQGAYDYLAKPFKLAEVTVAVGRALDDHRLRRENARLRAEVERQQGLDRILGRSKIMQETVSQIRAVAGSDSSVLLLGESGTGKELVAQAIHWASPRRGGRFMAVNCAAVPETLLESELFGHEKGAFTGADRRREGLFAAASGGTLFLDEVGDMPPATQAKLLRVLQDRAVRPVGGTASTQLDLRIVTATNKDLPAMVKDGRFREDLYYRLAVIPIRLPSLRERPEDIRLIAEHYLRETVARLGKEIEGFDETALSWMEHHTWPGNVRELENVIERAVVLTHTPRITRADLGTEFTLYETNSPLRPTLAKLEGQYVRRVLEEVRGDKVAAAKILGVSVRTLQRRFKEL